jgi:hypothetical protein
MTSVTLTGLEEAIGRLDFFETQQMPFALAKTLTDIADIAKNNAVKEMKTVFDRPTPFTLNALKVERATKRNLEAKLLLKDPTRIDDPHHYLNVEVAGGPRGFKPFEARLYRKGLIPTGDYAVPNSGADFDAFGNMKRGQITQMLSYFDAFGDAGFRANMGDEGRRRLGKTTRKKRGMAYFAAEPGNKQSLAPGIYKRVNTVFGSAITRVLLFSGATHYEPRISLERILEETRNADGRSLFERNIEAAMRSARWA